jgi:hypothetical protein
MSVNGKAEKRGSIRSIVWSGLHTAALDGAGKPMHIPNHF